MTTIAAIVVRVHTPTVTPIMKPIERPASLRSSRMTIAAKITAMTATRSEIQAMSDHWMSAGNMDVLSASGLTLYLPCLSGARSRGFRLVAVADTPYGHDAPGHGRVGLELLAQPPHMDGDSRGVAERPAPHLGQQLLAGEGLTRVPHQEDEQVVLAGGQLDQLAVDPDLVRGQVHNQVSVGHGTEIELVRQAGTARPA